MAEIPPETRIPTSLRGSLGGFVTRAVMAVVVVGGALLLWRLRDALAIGLGSVVLAIGFRGLAGALHRRVGLPVGWSLGIVVVLALGIVAFSFEVFGATLAGQFGVLSQKLPQGLRSVEQSLDGNLLGRDIVAQARTGLISMLTGSGPQVAAGVLTAAAQTLTYVAVMVAGGVFLAIDPDRYHGGVLALIPQARRAHYDRILGALGEALRRWLLGRLVVMVAVGVMSTLGLWALGIDAPVALGLTGAILSFIPNLGSVLATLPAMLIGFLQDPVKALWVGLAIWAVHFVEGNFITPYVQDEAVAVPPVISIFSTVVFALLLGPVGVFLTGPITVVAIVLVQRLYIEDVLGEKFMPRERQRRTKR